MEHQSAVRESCAQQATCVLSRCGAALSLAVAVVAVVLAAGCGPLELPPDPLPPDPTEPSDIPVPVRDSAGLIMITHGWNSRADDGWPQEMGEHIANLIDTSEWVVDWYDWREDATGLPPYVAGRAVEHGYWLGRHLAPQGWQHIHFIAHSAGSWLVEQAAMSIREYAEPDPTIHITFLDAYVPLASSYHAGLLGRHADWADHYFVPDVTGFFTQAILPHAHNVNLDASKPPQGFGHSFPHRWYCESVRFAYPTAEAPPCADSHGEAGEPSGFEVYGFVRGLEGGGPGAWAGNPQITGYPVCNQQNPPCTQAVDIGGVIDMHR